MQMTNCKWCGGKTVNIGPKECDRCWELRHKIEGNMELVKKMIKHFDKSMNQRD